MKFIHYSHSDLGSSVASTEHIMQVVDNLIRMGDDVTVIVPDWGNRYSRETGARLVYLPFINLKGLRSLSFDVAAFLYLVYHYIHDKPDLLYQRRNGLDPFPAVFARLSRIPLVTELNEVLETYGLELKYFRLLSPILRAIERITFKESSLVTPLSERQKEVVIRDHPWLKDRIFVQPSGIDTDIFRPLPRRRCIKELGLREDLDYIVWVGYFFPWIGLEVLVDAGEDIINEYPRAQFILIGDGAHRPDIEEMVMGKGLKDHFLFTGYIGKERLPLYYGAARLCVAPYRASRLSGEGFPSYKVFEYLACGRPVVCSRGRGNVEWIEKYKLGHLVEPEDKEALAGAVLSVLRSKKETSQMGKRAREVIEREGFTWEKAVKEIRERCVYAVQGSMFKVQG